MWNIRLDGNPTLTQPSGRKKNRMKLQDYLHYYMGCKMTHKDNLGAAYILHFDVVRIAIDHGDLPVLRKLEDMTEDEMIGLVQSMLPVNLEDKPTADDYSLEMF